MLDEAAERNNEDPTPAFRSLVNREYFKNFNTVSELAVGLGGKPGVPLTPFDEPDDEDATECDPSVTHSFLQER